MSYLLIGFWYERPSANAAAIKAFVVNRVGDFGFALGIFLTFQLTGSVTFDQVFAAAPGLAGKTVHFIGFDWDAATLACLLLFMGAMGKSAQFLLHTWLPDAMEGPTPVSALIHAATMVTAGVFMVARLSPLFEMSPAALSVVLIVGATTAFFAATVGLVQNDIKRVIAYSTCSQLGYMFVGLGVGGYSLGMFHLFTHAFFKALLFLGAGSVITAMHHEQDMRRMGGLRTEIPVTFWMMVDRLAGADRRRHSLHFDRLRRLRVEGPDHRGRLRLASFRRDLRILVRRHRGRLHRLLFLAAPVHDLLRPSRRLGGLAAGRARTTKTRAPRRARSAPAGSGRSLAASARMSARPCSRPCRGDPRELPPVMLVARALAVGAAGRVPSATGSSAAASRNSGGVRCSSARRTTSSKRWSMSPARLAVADADDARRPAGRDLHVRRRQDGAEAARRRLPGALPVPAQQVVLRRALRRDLRPSGLRHRSPLLEGRRRRDHRRLRAGRGVGPRPRRDPRRGPAAVRLRLSIRVRDAARRGRARDLVSVRGRPADVRVLDPLEPPASCRSSARRSSSCCRAKRRRRSATRAGSRSSPRSSPSC